MRFTNVKLSKERNRKDWENRSLSPSFYHLHLNCDEERSLHHFFVGNLALFTQEFRKLPDLFIELVSFIYL
jgi:hypothetical protein